MQSSFVTLYVPIAPAHPIGALSIHCDVPIPPVPAISALLIHTFYFNARK